MMRWGARILFLLILIAAGVACWRWFFPSPEKAVRKRLTEVAETASFAANEGAVAKLQNAQKLISYCTADIEIAVDALGQRITCTGKDELLQAVMFSRTKLFGSLTLQFVDPVVTIAPNKQTAFVNVTVRGKVPNDRDMLVQECKFTLQKSGRNWLVRKAETVKTLSL